MKENYYLLDYLKENYVSKADIIDIFKFSMDAKIYSYGQQFRLPEENNKKYLNNFFLSYFYRKIKILKQEFGTQNDNSIISDAYFSTNDELRKIGYSVVTPPWGYSKDSSIIPSTTFLKKYYSFRSFVSACNYNDFFSKEFSEKYA